MNTQDLEKMLEDGAETPQLDFKESCPWKVETFVKDILAMANTQDGGQIIIGVEEKQKGVFIRQGIAKKDKATYKIDEMKDQMTVYADPHVDFSIDFPKDMGGLEYTVLKIYPFQEIPVICRKNGVDVKEGGIYFRNRNRRVESALVSNSYDMRDIIERAALKIRARAQQIGYVLPTKNAADILQETIRKRLEEERGDL